MTAVYLDRRRGARDFGERDRLLLNLLRPHLNQAYQNAVAVTRMRREIDLFEHGADGAESGLVLLPPDGEPPILTTRASQWLTKYFGASRKGGTHLPAALERWLAFQDRRFPRVEGRFGHRRQGCIAVSHNANLGHKQQSRQGLRKWNRVDLFAVWRSHAGE